MRSVWAVDGRGGEGFTNIILAVSIFLSILHTLGKLGQVSLADNKDFIAKCVSILWELDILL